VALKIQPKYARTVEALARLISRLILKETNQNQNQNQLNQNQTHSKKRSQNKKSNIEKRSFAQTFKTRAYWEVGEVTVDQLFF
jgi:hypothetical protein